jgi:hypothetical protein
MLDGRPRSVRMASCTRAARSSSPTSIAKVDQSVSMSEMRPPGRTSLHLTAATDDLAVLAEILSEGERSLAETAADVEKPFEPHRVSADCAPMPAAGASPPTLLPGCPSRRSTRSCGAVVRRVPPARCCDRERAAT